MRLDRIRPTLRRLAGGSLTRRIVFLNLIGLFALLYGILYLNQFQAGLIDARVQSLLVQGEILARAVAGTATVESDSIELDTDTKGNGELEDDLLFNPGNFFIDPSKTAPVVRRLLQPARLRARIYDRDGLLLFDTRYLYARENTEARKDNPPGSIFVSLWNFLSRNLSSQALPRYREYGTLEGKFYPEVTQALEKGQSASIVRAGDKDELIVSVAVPIQRQNQLVGALLLSTFGGDIDAVLLAERMGIVRVFIVAAVVMVLLSILMASTIAGPLKKLAEAAERVRRGIKKREQIPDFTNRFDEIGHLSGALRDMTRALYSRIEAIERFAADVAHELKNPLTSLRSAVDTLPIVKNDKDRTRLLAIIGEDVSRLDRLITDISAASRLDAELQRQNETIVDLKELLFSMVGFYEDMRGEKTPPVHLSVKSETRATAFHMLGQESRLSQVISNLIDNAISFSPANSEVQVSLERQGSRLVIMIDDNGPGIAADPPERIFERFYTDRPEADFGIHSGLGLSISKQIIEAHQGKISAGNRVDETGKIMGARFVVSFPAVK